MRKVYLWVIAAALVGFGLFFVARMAVKYLGDPEDHSVVQRVKKTDQDVTTWALDWRDKLLGDPEAQKLDLDNPGAAEFDFLEAKLESKDDESRRAATKALVEIGKPRSFRPVIASIPAEGNDGQFVLDSAMEILDRAPQEVRANLLIYTYDTEADDLPEFAIWGLRARMRQEGLLEPEFLQDALATAPNPSWRRFAVQELAALDPPHTGAVAAALADPDETVRAQAAKTLADLIN